MTAANEDWEARVREAKIINSARLMAYPNVTGVGIGYRISGGRRLKEVCLRVYVSRKVPEDQLQQDEILPRTVDDVAVDVVEGDFQAMPLGIGDMSLGERRARHPILLVGGISVGGLGVTAGTLGASVLDNGSGQQLILSNWHVLCGHPVCDRGEEIVQPGVFDGGSASDVVARLARSVLRESVDAACAEISGHRFLLPVIAGIGYVRGVGAAALGMRVRKSGRTTGLTSGVLDDISCDVKVRGYPEGTLTFRNQLVAVSESSAPIVMGGDSGSLVVDDENRAVGLLFAGPRDGSRFIANPIPAVLDALGIGMAIDLSILESVTGRASVSD